MLSRLDLRLDPDDRIALLGANGNGKTTFARLLAGAAGAAVRRDDRGRRSCACGFFAQHQIEEMRPEESALHHLAAAMPDERPERVRTRLGGFGFGQDKAVRAARLSRAASGRGSTSPSSPLEPPLLILDEPTNHLDIETREALVEALNDFAGAVVLVSHDWHLVELVADRLWLVADGTVRPFDGDLDDYHRSLLAGPAGERPAATGTAPIPSACSASGAPRGGPSSRPCARPPRPPSASSSSSPPSSAASARSSPTARPTSARATSWKPC